MTEYQAMGEARKGRVEKDGNMEREREEKRRGIELFSCHQC